MTTNTTTATVPYSTLFDAQNGVTTSSITIGTSDYYPVSTGFVSSKDVIINGSLFKTVEVQKLLAVSEIPKIKDYAIYNNRAVKVEFEDGTFTKCVCDADTDFDFYTGFAFCLIKKMLGKDGHKKFNDIMRKAMKRLDEIDRAKDEAEKEEARRKEKKRKAALKKVIKAEKAHQEQIDIITAALDKYGKVI